MAISIHAWDSVVRDADCLSTLFLGVALFRLMFPMSYRWIWASTNEAADLGSRGHALLALVFGGRGGLLGLFIPKNIVHSHLCEAVCNIKMRICTKTTILTLSSLSLTIALDLTIFRGCCFKMYPHWVNKVRIEMNVPWLSLQPLPLQYLQGLCLEQ